MSKVVRENINIRKEMEDLVKKLRSITSLLMTSDVVEIMESLQRGEKARNM